MGILNLLFLLTESLDLHFYISDFLVFVVPKGFLTVFIVGVGWHSEIRGDTQIGWLFVIFVIPVLSSHDFGEGCGILWSIWVLVGFWLHSFIWRWLIAVTLIRLRELRRTIAGRFSLVFDLCITLIRLTYILFLHTFTLRLFRLLKCLILLILGVIRTSISTHFLVWLFMIVSAIGLTPYFVFVIMT